MRLRGVRGDHNKIQTEWYYTATDFEMSSIHWGISFGKKRDS